MITNIMNFLRRYKLLSVATAGTLGIVLYLDNNLQNKQLERASKITYEYIQEDLETLDLSENGKKLLSQCCISVITRPSPGRHYFLWLKTDKGRYYLHDHHKMMKVWYRNIE